MVIYIKLWCDLLLNTAHVSICLHGTGIGLLRTTDQLGGLWLKRGQSICKSKYAIHLGLLSKLHTKLHNQS